MAVNFSNRTLVCTMVRFVTDIKFIFYVLHGAADLKKSLAN